MNGRSFIWVFTLLVASAAFAGKTVSVHQSECMMRIKLTPEGTARVTESYWSTFFRQNPHWLEDSINKGLESPSSVIQTKPFPFPKAAAFQGLSGNLQATITMRNIRVSDLRAGKPQVKCEADHCQVKLPVESMKFTADFVMKCHPEGSCKDDLVHINQISMGFDAKKDPLGPVPPALVYDAVIDASADQTHILKIVSNTGRIKFPMNQFIISHVALNIPKEKQDKINQDQAHWAQMINTLEESCRDPEAITPAGKEILRALGNADEMAWFVTKSTLGDYIKNRNSASFYDLFSQYADLRRAHAGREVAGERAEAQKWLGDNFSQFVDSNIAPALAGCLNQAIQSSKFFNDPIHFDIEAKSLKKMDLENKAEKEHKDADTSGLPKLTHQFVLTEAAKEKNGDVTLGFNHCGGPAAQDFPPAPTQDRPKLKIIEHPERSMIEDPTAPIRVSMTEDFIQNSVRTTFSDPKQNIFHVQGREFRVEGIPKVKIQTVPIEKLTAKGQPYTVEEPRITVDFQFIEKGILPGVKNFLKSGIHAKVAIELEASGKVSYRIIEFSRGPYVRGLVDAIFLIPTFLPREIGNVPKNMLYRNGMDGAVSVDPSEYVGVRFHKMVILPDLHTAEFYGRFKDLDKAMEKVVKPDDQN
jgi:hypothetical protein